MNPTQQNMIDAYLRNELTGSELSSFESQMESDPAFREAVRFEQHVQEGIGQYRKAELKARLNALDMSPGSIGVGQLGNGALLKTVGGFVAAGIIGAVGYFLYVSEEDVPTAPVDFTESVTLSPEQKDIPPLILPEPLTEEPVEPLKAVVAEAEVINHSNKNNTTTEVDDAPVHVNEMKAAEQQMEEEFIPQVDVPNLDEIASEEAFASTDVKIPVASSRDEINASTLDVETINRRSDVIKYKYFDGKLYLYGDFKRQPYEILEIHGSTDRKLFVYYDSRYYRVTTTDKVEELVQITDRKLIHELEILRSNKVTE